MLLKKGSSRVAFNDLIQYFINAWLVSVIISGESEEEKHHHKEEDEKAAEGKRFFFEVMMSCAKMLSDDELKECLMCFFKISCYFIRNLTIFQQNIWARTFREPSFHKPDQSFYEANQSFEAKPISHEPV